VHTTGEPFNEKPVGWDGERGGGVTSDSIIVLDVDARRYPFQDIFETKNGHCERFNHASAAILAVSQIFQTAAHVFGPPVEGCIPNE